jgi:hypothetical protein
MFLVSTFLETCVVAAKSRTLAGGQHALSRWLMLLSDSHNTMPFPRCSHAVTLPRPCHESVISLSERHIRGMAGYRQGNGMVCLNQTRPHCINQIEKTQSKPLAERHGRGTAGERQGNGRGTVWYCESALTMKGHVHRVIYMIVTLNMIFKICVSVTEEVPIGSVSCSTYPVVGFWVW